MANVQFSNNALSTLASGITSGATSLTVATGQGALFPTLSGAQYFYCTLTNSAESVREIVKVTARSSDTFTITRAQEGTSAAAWNTGDKVELRATAQGLNDLISGLASTGANTFTGNQTGGDNQLIQWQVKDLGYVVVDKGNSSTTTQTYDYTAGSVQKSTATGNHTIAFSNWPPTGNEGIMKIVGVNFGAYTITWPTINWIKPDGTTTTTFSTWLAAVSGRTALQSSGTDEFLIWTRDGGTTLYGKFA